MSYIKRWYNQFHEISGLSWASLDTAPLWNHFQKSARVITSEFSHVRLKENALFDEACNVSRYVTAKKLELFEPKSKKPCGNMKAIIEYCMCLPGTNAPVERMFSLMNKVWTAEKTQLQVAILKAMLMLKVNVQMTCEQYHGHISKNEGLLRKIHSSQKF
ncbi:unnamed protein product [Ixodes pacificus]